MILWIIRLLRYRQPKPKANHVNNNWPELHARTNLQVTMADKGKLFIEIFFSFLLSFAKSVYIHELCRCTWLKEIYKCICTKGIWTFSYIGCNHVQTFFLNPPIFTYSKPNSRWDMLSEFLILFSRLRGYWIVSLHSYIWDFSLMCITKCCYLFFG